MSKRFHNTAKFMLSFDFAGMHESLQGYVDVTRPVLGFAKRNPEASVEDLRPLMEKITRSHGAVRAVLIKEHPSCVVMEIEVKDLARALNRFKGKLNGQYRLRLLRTEQWTRKYARIAKNWYIKKLLSADIAGKIRIDICYQKYC